MTLSDRILSASTDAEAREVLEALWDLSPHAWSPKYAYREFSEMAEMESAASRMGAVMMLVDPAYFWATTMLNENRGGFHACYLYEGSMEWIEAPTAWQALAAAIAKTREG